MLGAGAASAASEAWSAESMPLLWRCRGARVARASTAARTQWRVTKLSHGKIQAALVNKDSPKLRGHGHPVPLTSRALGPDDLPLARRLVRARPRPAAADSCPQSGRAAV